MHKFKLQFLNQDVERNYIQEHQFPKRKFYLKVCTIGTQVLLIFKLIFSLVEENYSITYPLLVTWGITIPFLLIPTKTDIQIRFTIIALNIIYIAYLLFFDPSEEAQIMYFKGASQMTANIVNILVLEFIDSSILCIVLLAMRIAHLIMYSTKIELTSIMFGICVQVLLILMMYIYHKALRSQYLLTKTDQRWEKILRQIIHDQKFILIKFDKEKIKFISTTSTFSKKIQSQDEVISFIRNSKIKDSTFEQYIYKYMNNFQQNCIDSLNNILMVTYQRQLMKLNLSIFFGNQPTILIQKYIPQQESNIKYYQNKSKLYLNMIISLIKIIKKNKKFNSIKFHLIAKKIFLKNLIQTILNHNFSSQMISFNTLLNKVSILNNKKKQIQLQCQDLQFTTIPKIFQLFLVLFIECQHNEILLIKEIKSDNKLITIKFGGALNVQKLKTYVSKLEYYFHLIFQNIKFDDNYVKVQLNQEIFVPFKNLSSINTQDDILFQ